MPKPVGQCASCGAEGPLGEPCSGEYCLGSGAMFEPLEGREGNIEARAVEYEERRRREAEAEQLERELEEDVRALTEDVDGINVDASKRGLPRWLQRPWLWGMGLLVALLVVIFARSDSDLPVAPEREKDRKMKLSDEAIALKKAVTDCENGVFTDCMTAAHWMKKGIGTQPSPIRAEGFMERACEKGLAEACHTLGQWLEDAGEKEPKQRAKLLYVRACEAGEARSCALAALRVRDLGVEMTYARTLAKKACDGKSRQGCYVLASMTERGEGGEPDEARAEYLYRRACDDGLGDACNDLAILLSQRDPAETSEKVNSLFVRACETSSAMGCFNLGMLYETGAGFLPSPSKAFEFHKAACELGHGHACYRVALAYEGGKGVAADSYRSREFKKRACAKGFHKACR